MNFQLACIGFPNVIVKNKEKLNYYFAFNEYNESKKTKTMVDIVGKALTESLYKRLAYLKGLKIITLSDYAKRQKINRLICLIQLKDSQFQHLEKKESGK